MVKAKFIYESIKHLKPRSKEELAKYLEEYKDWEPDGYLTLSNDGGIEIKMLDDGAVEYRFNYGEDNIDFPTQTSIEWGIDEESEDNTDNDWQPYFSIGEDKYFLSNFMRMH